jgi:hypothetical protein
VLKMMLGWAPVALGALAAIFGFMAARVTVRDNINVFIQDIARQSRYATWAGLAAMLAAAAQMLDRALS